MGKKNKEMNLGRTLIKDRFGMQRRLKMNGDNHLHSLDMHDGFNWGLLNLHSVTEKSSFQEYFTTAEFVEAEFQAEKLNIQFSKSKEDISSLLERKNAMIQLLEDNNEFLQIPRRPKWDKSMTMEELQIKEKNEFSKWRKKLASLQEINGVSIIPYEKNLECWKQLWRVIERSDIIIQVVDARNPLLFWNKDLEQYVKEVNINKINILLINKSDFLTKQQRNIWSRYFSKVGVQIVFFSATLAVQSSVIKSCQNEDKTSEEESDVESMFISNMNEKTSSESIRCNLNNSPNILDRKNLISLIKSVYVKQSFKNPAIVGLVGYPNVGKSSIINALFMEKKVSASATPGKTKHFQTLYLSKDLILCDCPGLVMPSIIQTKAELILNGILPISQIQDYIAPMNVLGTLIPKHIIEELYGMEIPFTTKTKDVNQTPTAVEILNAHGYNRGFMTRNGQPDNSRSARCILKDFVNGKLLYCTAPPNYNQIKFHPFSSKKEKIIAKSTFLSETKRNIETEKSKIKDLDNNFFQKNIIDVHIKGKNIPLKSASTSTKPWKINKNSIKKSHKKTRNTYAHLDKH